MKAAQFLGVSLPEVIEMPEELISAAYSYWLTEWHAARHKPGQTVHDALDVL